MVTMVTITRRSVIIGNHVGPFTLMIVVCVCVCLYVCVSVCVCGWGVEGVECTMSMFFRVINWEEEPGRKGPPFS